jgi:hypothetical protein
MMYRLTSWLAAALMLFSIQATAASLSDIQVSNGDRQARITISFIGEPEYSFSPRANASWRWILNRLAYSRGYRCSLAAIIW